MSSRPTWVMEPKTLSQKTKRKERRETARSRALPAASRDPRSDRRRPPFIRWTLLLLCSPRIRGRARQPSLLPRGPLSAAPSGPQCPKLCKPQAAGCSSEGQVLWGRQRRAVLGAWFIRARVLCVAEAPHTGGSGQSPGIPCPASFLGGVLKDSERNPQRPVCASRYGTHRLRGPDHCLPVPLQG